jgi:phosphopentomutase
VAQLFSRIIVIVMDSVGIGELHDAAAYGDQGSNTLGNIARRVSLKLPTLRSLGLGQLVTLDPEKGTGVVSPERLTKTTRVSFSAGKGAVLVCSAVGRMAEASPGKDSVTGHWEMMGIVLDKPFPVFPDGFPSDMMSEFERRIGRGTLGNVAASGTKIIDEFGEEHVSTGKPIVYTSADSVFQIAAHEDVIPVEELYRICRVAFDLAVMGKGLGRVIARPFVGERGSYRRTSNRHDFAMTPTSETVLDRLSAAAIPTVAVGKIQDLFAGQGISRSVHTASDAEGMDAVERELGTTENGLIFANLVDFDTLYGHRNDVNGYAANLERFDVRLASLLPSLRNEDLLVVTADHGNDPTTPSTDHSREHVPLLAIGPHVKAGGDLGTRRTFADLGQTIADNFNVGPMKHGVSFLDDIDGKHS